MGIQPSRRFRCGTLRRHRLHYVDLHHQPGVIRQRGEINASKMAILAASLTAGVAGFLWLKLPGGPVRGDDDMDAMDFAPTPRPSAYPWVTVNQ
jgi:hypothetical protein